MFEKLEEFFTCVSLLKLHQSLVPVEMQGCIGSGGTEEVPWKRPRILRTVLDDVIVAAYIVPKGATAAR